jgi:hypothetical protein
MDMPGLGIWEWLIIMVSCGICGGLLLLAGGAALFLIQRFKSNQANDS